MMKRNEPPNRIAFLIQAHADPVHLRRLVRALAGHDIFVHWDAKSGSPPDVPGAFMIAERVSVFWAGFSQVEASIALIRAALSSGQQYSKLVLLSGSCYPIRPVADLVKMFQDDGGRNYINAVRVEDSAHLKGFVYKRIWRDAVLPLTWRRTPRMRKVERILRAGLNLVISRLPKPALNLELFHGSNWWALTPVAAAHALSVYDADTKVREFYRFTFASDEQFFTTALRNSFYAESCGPVTPYIGRGTFRTANLHLLDASLSKWFDETDAQDVLSSEMYFVRKVRSPQSDTLIEMIDVQRLSQSTNGALRT